MLKNSFCVDDLVAGADTEEEAMELYTETKEIIAHASVHLHLRKWASDSDVLRQQFENDFSSVRSM